MHIINVFSTHFFRALCLLFFGLMIGNVYGGGFKSVTVGKVLGDGSGKWKAPTECLDIISNTVEISYRVNFLVNFTGIYKVKGQVFTLSNSGVPNGTVPLLNS
ncbi:MAG: hypothetical protein AB8H47_19660, partial [Bacteroidia bacterium]